MGGWMGGWVVGVCVCVWVGGWVGVCTQSHTQSHSFGVRQAAGIRRREWRGASLGPSYQQVHVCSQRPCRRRCPSPLCVYLLYSTLCVENTKKLPCKSFVLCFNGHAGAGPSVGVRGGCCPASPPLSFLLSASLPHPPTPCLPPSCSPSPSPSPSLTPARTLTHPRVPQCARSALGGL